MEELAIEIAETLDISVQGAIDMYPVIRSQYVWYQVLTNIPGWTVLLVFILVPLIVITFSIRGDTNKFGQRTEEVTEEWVNIDKILKIELSILALLVVIGIVADMVVPFLAPDIMLINDILN